MRQGGRVQLRTVEKLHVKKVQLRVLLVVFLFAYLLTLILYRVRIFLLYFCFHLTMFLLKQNLEQCNLLLFILIN